MRSPRGGKGRHVGMSTSQPSANLSGVPAAAKAGDTLPWGGPTFTPAHVCPFCASAGSDAMHDGHGHPRTHNGTESEAVLIRVLHKTEITFSSTRFSGKTMNN